MFQSDIYFYAFLHYSSAFGRDLSHCFLCKIGLFSSSVPLSVYGKTDSGLHWSGLAFALEDC